MRDNKEEDATTRRKGGIVAGFRASFLTGLAVLAPIALTMWLIWSVVGWIDSFVWPFVPAAYHPEVLVNRWLGHPDLNHPDHITINIRGVGVVIFLIFTVIVGWLAKGIIGRQMIAWGEGIVDRMPVVRSIYNGLKQIAETILSQSETKFDKACLIEYPRKGLWGIGFVSTHGKGEMAVDPLNGEKLYSVFLATTPNPTSGFLLYVPESQIHWLKMSVEDAAKLIISAGLVYPSDKDGNPPRLDAVSGDHP
ncbi:MAG: DUF502 domain-containing protein [Paracoccaceae bacterium]